MFRDLLLTFVLPPGGPILIIAAGLVLVAWHRRPGLKIAFLGMVLLWLSTTTLVGDSLIRFLEAPPLPDEKLLHGLGAIIVLGSDVIRSSPEFLSDTIDQESLARLRYAARVARKTGTPILVSGGGRLPHPMVSEAEVMARDLKMDFGLEVAWIESTSTNTAESARKSFALLEPVKRTRIAVVTSAWHMPRAERAFHKAGFDVIAAPTIYLPRKEQTLRDWLPGAVGLIRTQIALRELLGLFWYRLQGTA